MRALLKRLSITGLALILASLSGCNSSDSSSVETNFLGGIYLDARLSTVSISPTSLSAGGSSTVRLISIDQNGNRYVSPTPLSFSFWTAGGTSSGTFGPVTDNGNGVYTTTFTATTSGSPARILASVNGEQIISSAPWVTVFPGNYSLVFSTLAATPNIVPSLSSANVTLTSEDTAGNPITVGGLTVAFSTAGGTSTGSFGPVVDNGDGTYTAAWTGLSPGTATTFQATIFGAPITSVLPQATVIAGPLNQVTSTVSAVPGSITADGVTTSTVTVTLEDLSGYPIPGKTVTLTSARGATDTVAPASGVSNASGVVTFTVKSTTSSVGNVAFTAKDTTDNITLTQQGLITFNPGIPNAAQSTAVATLNSLTANGTTTTVIVTLKDIFGNVVPGKTISLTSSRGASDSISTVSSTSNAAGVVTFTVGSTVSGMSTYTAKDTTDTVTIVQQPTITFHPGPVAQLVFTQNPTNAIAGAIIAPSITVTAEDLNNNLVPSYVLPISVNFISNPGGSTLSGTVTRTAVAGIATFNDISLNKSGIGYTLSAFDGTYSGVSGAFNISPAGVSAATSTVTTSLGSVTANGTSTATITVTLLDVFGNPVPGKTVSLASSRGAMDSISAASGPSDASGHVTFTVTSTTAGSSTYSGTDVTDSTSIAPSVANVTYVPGPVTQLVFTQNPTNTASGAVIGPVVTVAAQDASGNTVPGYASTITVQINTDAPLSDAGTLSGTLTQAPVAGVSSFNDLSINYAGTYTLSATSGIYSVVSNSFTITPSAFLASWTFGAGQSGNYTYNASKIQITGGIASVIPVNQTDQNNTATGFGGGTNNGTTWNGTSGDTCTSCVILNATTNTAEFDSSWTPAWGNLVGLWHLDEAAASPTVADSSTAGNTGTPQAGTTLGVAGKLQTAAQLNGATFIKIPNSASLDTPATVSVSAWIKTVTGGVMQVFNAGDGNTHDYQLYVNSGPADLWSNGVDLAGATKVNDGMWHHLVGVWDGVHGTLYVDGIFSKQANMVFSGIVLDNQIGTQCTGVGSTTCNQYFTGTIDEVAVWNTALTAAQVQTIYSRQAAKYSGTFTSRVFDAASAAQGWTTLNWSTTLPFLKELPDGASSETNTNYSEVTDNTLMTGNVGLWHLDETAGPTIQDRSGSANTGTTAGGITLNQGGLLGTAPTFNGTTGVISIGNSTSLLPNSQISVSAWIQPSAWGAEEPIFDDWVAAANSMVLLRVTNGIIQGYISDGSGTQQGGGFTGAADVSLLQWQHVVLVADGTVVRGYYNGQPLPNKFPYNGTLNTAATNPFYIGEDNGNYFAGKIDEVAIWNRSLSASEVLQLYRRGANRIKYQLRTCTLSDCSDNPGWLGPDNSNQTYFTELNNNAVQSAGGDLTLADTVQTGLPSLLFSNFGALTVPNNEYFQYRSILESDDASTSCTYNSTATWCSPELQTTSIGPNHFPPGSPTLTNNIPVDFYTLSSLSAVLGGNGCSAGLQFTISRDGVNWYYWTGAAWGLADGTYAESNTAAVITTNAATFQTQLGSGNIYFTAFMNATGAQACEISSISIGGTQ